MQGMWGRRALIGSLLAGSMLAGMAQAQTFDPRAHKGPQHGVPNEVMVLGSAHLAVLPKTFDPSHTRKIWPVLSPIWRHTRRKRRLAYIIRRLSTINPHLRLWIDS